MRRIFVLSPAHCGGERARLALNERAQFSLAARLRTPQGAPLGEVFSFLSGLYFRGKLAYARAFASPPPGVPGVQVITTNRGLWPAEECVTRECLEKFLSVSIHEDESRYRDPLSRDATRLAREMGPRCQVVLLGSVATGKYLDVLAEVLGDRLRFPAEFVGRGDMSRGSLLLRCVEERRELLYVSARLAERRGARPPRFAPRT